MKTLMALVLSLTLAGIAYADIIMSDPIPWIRERDWNSGLPAVLTIDVDATVPYDFSGEPLPIPFTLNGTQAMVYLAVYSKEANPHYGGEPLGVGGIGNAMLRRAGLDTLISVTAGEAFPEGAHTIAWDGRDFLGNVMPEGEYTFYLIGIDNISNPTWVGPTADPQMWVNSTIDERFDPPLAWHPQSGQEEIRRSTIGRDYHIDPEAYETFTIPWMNELRGENNMWDISFLEIDPVDPNVMYIGNYRGENVGYWKAIYNPDASTIRPDTTWKASDGTGWVRFPQRIADSGLRKAPHHPWLEDDGLIYMSHMDRTEPIAPGIMYVDRATGEMVDFLDLSAIYNVVQVDESGNKVIAGSWAPWAMEMDERGFYTTQPSNLRKRWPGCFTFEGEILWQNRNGDWYGDHYTEEECAALGENCVVGNQHFMNQMRVGKYHIAIGSGYNDPFSMGLVFGPDGSGLFQIPIKSIPAALTGQAWWQATDSAYSGFYHQTGGSQGGLVHWPFDARMGSISVDEPTAVEPVAAADLPGSYELGDNYPNPFNSDTRIEFAIAAGGPVRLVVYNAAGQEVVTLVDGTLEAGFHETTWDGRNDQGDPVASGVYVYRLQAGDLMLSRRAALLR